MKKALITGITGQDGAYLTKHLLNTGEYEVIGMRRRASTNDVHRLTHLGVDHVDIRHCDLTEPYSLRDIIQKVEPDEIYNLGAQSFVGSSFDIPLYTFDTNAVAVARLLDCVLSINPDIKIYQASTSEMFGKVKTVPQNEETPFHPRSPYGVAKLAAYWWVRNYRESYDMFACNGILFNHESPLRGIEFVTRKITNGLAKYYAGTGGTTYLGNLSAERDWGHAEDYCVGMHLMMQHETPDDYVLATGNKYSVREFCNFAANYLGITLEWDGLGTTEKGIDKRTGKIVFAVDHKFFRPAEVDLLIGDPTKAKTVLNWKPKHTITTLVEDMMKHDLSIWDSAK